MATTTAARLLSGDMVEYGPERIQVKKVMRLSGDMVEVYGMDEDPKERWIDYGSSEQVTVVGGPTFEAARVGIEPLVETATSKAVWHLATSKRLGSHPATIRLVLLALAGLQDGNGGAPQSAAAVAHLCGLSEGTVKGYLGTLYQVGMVTRANAWAPYSVVGA